MSREACEEREGDGEDTDGRDGRCGRDVREGLEGASRRPRMDVEEARILARSYGSLASVAHVGEADSEEQ